MSRRTKLGDKVTVAIFVGENSHYSAAIVMRSSAKRAAA
jgi:hypothetical protein